MRKKIRILIVDDSVLMRRMLSTLLAEDTEIEVLDTAKDPYDAREKIKNLNPDVLTLDVEMPKMDGLSFLEKIMALRPMPVVMVSTLTGKGTDTAVAALQTGAVECIAKPNIQSEKELQAFAAELREKIHTAASARIRSHGSKLPQQAPVTGQFTLRKDAPKFIAIGASTGGVEALTEILVHLPKQTPPIVITQHMPPGFTASFAKRLSTISTVIMKEGASGMTLEPGTAIIAPGAKHMMITEHHGEFRCRITDDPPVNNHKPSVDVLFDSVAKVAGKKALGIILTGMGKDGGMGLLHMREAGAHTIGQDESSCVVYGMPRYARELGAITEVKTLTRIADAIKLHCFM